MAEAGAPLELPPESTLAETPEQKGFWKKLKRGLFMTHTELLAKVSSAVSGKAELDERALEFIREDELVEVTPVSFRLRKRILQANRRK